MSISPSFKNVKFTPFWWEGASLLQQSLDILPERVDVVIIGAGFTGLTAALTCAREGCSVLVIEAGDPGFGASTRNAGMIGSGHRVAYNDLILRYGEPLSSEIIREGIQALNFTKEMIMNENMHCDFIGCGRFRGAWTLKHYEHMAHEIKVLNNKFRIKAHMISRCEQFNEINVEAYEGGCIFESHGALDPSKFLRGIIDRAINAGAQIASQTIFSNVTKTQSGQYLIKTNRGCLSANKVIIASNGYTNRSIPSLRRKVLPITSYMISTEVIGEDLVRKLIPGGKMIVETHPRHCYYRASPDGDRILLGGRAALHHIEPFKSCKILFGFLTSLFPDLKNVKITHSWTGCLGFSTDDLPHIGITSDGIYYAFGYSGSGVAMAPYLGWKVANKMLMKKEGSTVFDKIKHNEFLFRELIPLSLPVVNAWYNLKGGMRYN